MTPEARNNLILQAQCSVQEQVREILRGIGWDIVVQSNPIHAMSLASNFSLSRSSLSETDAEARRLVGEIGSIAESLVQLQNQLEGLPSSVRRNLNRMSEDFDLIKSSLGGPAIDASDSVSEFQRLSWMLLQGLEATEARLVHEGGPSRRGSPRNLKPHRVAFAAAEVYLIGLGEMPSAHNETAGQKLTGRYGEAVESLFDVLGLGVGASGPAKDAVNHLHQMSEEEIACLHLARCPLTRDFVSSEFIRVF